jgi:hypothetical protein
MSRVLVILAIVASALVIGYHFVYPTISYHARLSVLVDRGGQTMVGSSVAEISVISFPTFGGLLDEGVELRSRGEAAFLDLGDGKNLIALLGMGGFSHDDIVKIAQTTFFGEAYGPKISTLGSTARPARTLRPASESALLEWPVSRRVNRAGVGEDDPTIIEKAEAA